MWQLPVTVQDASVQVVWHVQEVEKEVMEEVPGKKPRKRSHRQMEYCYEPELEGAVFGAAIVTAIYNRRASHAFLCHDFLQLLCTSACQCAGLNHADVATAGMLVMF